MRIAFDVLAQLGVSHAEYAGLVYAAIANPSGLRVGDELAAAMLRPHLLELCTISGADVDAWRALADVVRSSRVLTAAVCTLADHADQVPQHWLAELRGLES